MTKLQCPIRGCYVYKFGVNNPTQQHVNEHLAEVHGEQVTDSNISLWQSRQDGVWEARHKVMEYLLHEVRLIDRRNWEVFANNAATMDIPPLDERTAYLAEAIEVLNQVDDDDEKFPDDLIRELTRRTNPNGGNVDNPSYRSGLETLSEMMAWGRTSGLIDGLVPQIYRPKLANPSRFSPRTGDKLSAPLLLPISASGTGGDSGDDSSGDDDSDGPRDISEKLTLQLTQPSALRHFQTSHNIQEGKRGDSSQSTSISEASTGTEESKSSDTVGDSPTEASTQILALRTRP